MSRPGFRPVFLAPRPIDLELAASGGTSMWDVVMIALTAIAFAGLIAYIYACERL